MPSLFLGLPPPKKTPNKNNGLVMQNEKVVPPEGVIILHN